jgi:flagellar biosynthesis protein FliQ
VPHERSIRRAREPWQVQFPFDVFQSESPLPFHLPISLRILFFTIIISPIFHRQQSINQQTLFFVKMPKTLITGANSFVAAQIIDQLIALGHFVVGSVRSSPKGDEILATHPEYAGKISFVTVSDYAKKGVWDEIMKEEEFDYVIHVAAPLLDDPRLSDFERDFLAPSVNG